jgi:hypothetical protein
MQLLGYDATGLFATSLAWMEVNDKLAGWAQAVGATIALFIAVAIPAWQRHAQTLDARRETAKLNLALAACCSFLIRDIHIFLNGIPDRASFARSDLRDDSYVSDLYQRIHALEQREISHARIVSLYTARGVLMLANRLLCDSAFQSARVSTDEMKHVHSGIERLTERLEISEFDADRALYACRSVEASWPARPYLQLLLWFTAFYQHRRVPLKHRLFATK